MGLFFERAMDFVLHHLPQALVANFYRTFIKSYLSTDTRLYLESKSSLCMVPNRIGMERLLLSNTEMSLQRLLCLQSSLFVMLCDLFEKADKRGCNSTINSCLFGQTLICL